ncbi:TetR/AcrR family transcriptional regulator [Streptomyces sp. HNM0574]|uniref:TetR/AcrR family transcriptional regulator n=1 Tax=Streptomyces sp. HNM0574 TaxID=2714954 RepID=UPI00146A7DDC|nr:TetR/AcrR family transcriptional regulator [Streptomyces sp. HNM0574]NLU66271.1 TetR/AcrR family transcriptional regulator [Streptomyces sp. HNM0574]
MDEEQGEAPTVWGRPERGARGPAPGYSRAELTAAAVRIADAHGLAAVSMRRVAGELGTGPASVYRYVSGRDDLVDLMTDAVTGEIDLRVPLTGDPVEDLTALARRAKEVHLRHPWLADVPPERLRIGPRGLDYLDHALGAMARVPLPGRTKTEIVALVSTLVTQFARTEAHSRRTPTARAAAQAAWLTSAAADGRHPHAHAALSDRPPEHPGEPDPFTGMLRRMLTGLLTPAS